MAMNPNQASAELKRRAVTLGFDAVGIAPLGPNPHAAELAHWLEAGYAGTMTYLHRQADKRKDPRRIMPEATVAVVTLVNYFHGPGTSPARVAQYAWSADYHRVLGTRLERLAAAIRDIAPAARTRVYVDVGPVPERELAQRAGLGWIGKNTMLLHPRLGSWFYIGVLLTTAELTHDEPLADRCGTCRACLDACPTDAFVAPYVLDARRCVSYLTIEHRGEIAPDAHAGMAGWQFGCDICQDVCPWNRKAPLTREAAFAPPAPFPGAAALSAMDDETLRGRLTGTSLLRAKPSGLRRNAAIYLENEA